jgi:hypothetical protein
MYVNDRKSVINVIIDEEINPNLVIRIQSQTRIFNNKAI